MMTEPLVYRLVRQYVAGWVRGDREMILETLAPDCTVIECYGPTYRGVGMVSGWIDAWFAPGNIVQRWQITSLQGGEAECAVEWEFECICAGAYTAFEGASIVRLHGQRIGYLREYTTTAPRFEWEGNDLWS